MERINGEYKAHVSCSLLIGCVLNSLLHLKIADSVGTVMKTT